MLIESDILISELDKISRDRNNSKKIRRVASLLKKWIDAIPPVDAIRVIRCQECKYAEGESLCLSCSIDYGRLVKPEGYCDNAEAK